MIFPNINDIAFFVCTCVLLPFVVAVNKKLYNNIEKEEHLEKGKVIQCIVKTFAIVQCSTWSCVFGSSILYRLFSGIIEPQMARYIISSIRFVYNLLRDYIGCHSLIIAICRYLFVIYNDTAESLGITRLRKIFISSSLLLPLLTTISCQITQPIDDFMIKWFHVQVTASNATISVNDTDYSNVLGDSLVNKAYESPLYLIFNENLPPSLIFGMNIVDMILFILIHANVIEGFIYLHFFVFSKRYLILIKFSCNVFVIIWVLSLIRIILTNVCYSKFKA